MKSCRKCKKLMIEALYVELNASRQKAFEQHLSGCADCKSEFEAMRVTLGVMDRRTTPEPSFDYSENLWPNVRRNIMEDEQPQSSSGRTWRMAGMRELRWVFRVATACTLIVVGILIDKYYLNGAVEETPVPEMVQVSRRTHDYLEKSKVLLLGVVNMDTEYGESGLKLKPQHKLSRELLKEAGYLKQVLDAPDHRRLQTLVAELERILLQLVNLEENYDLETVDLIKSSVNNQGILLKINVEAMQYDEETKKDERDDKRDQKKAKSTKRI